MSVQSRPRAVPFALDPAVYGCPFAAPALWHRVMVAAAAGHDARHDRPVATLPIHPTGAEPLPMPSTDDPRAAAERIAHHHPYGSDAAGLTPDQVLASPDF